MTLWKNLASSGMGEPTAVLLRFCERGSILINRARRFPHQKVCSKHPCRGENPLQPGSFCKCPSEIGPDIRSRKLSADSNEEPFGVNRWFLVKKTQEDFGNTFSRHMTTKLLKMQWQNPHFLISCLVRVLGSGMFHAECVLR